MDTIEDVERDLAANYLTVEIMREADILEQMFDPACEKPASLSEVIDNWLAGNSEKREEPSNEEPPYSELLQFGLRMLSECRDIESFQAVARWFQRNFST